MRGIDGISEELGQIVRTLPPDDLKRIVDIALRITSEDYKNDYDVVSLIEAYSFCQDTELAEIVNRKSRECDQLYIDLENEGKLQESQYNFKKMCVLNGLFVLLSSKVLNGSVVDKLVYNIGHGATSIDSFAQKMIQALR